MKPQPDGLPLPVQFSLLETAAAHPRSCRQWRRRRRRSWALERLEGKFLLSLLTPPMVTTGSASPISATGATVSGTVNPEGSTTTARFQYSTSTAFTPTVTTTIGSGFNHPEGVAVDAAGDVFVADTDNSAVKEVLPNGTIKTIGSGFALPEGVAVDAAGDVFVADYGHAPSRRSCPTAPSTPSAPGSAARGAWPSTQPATSSSPTTATAPSRRSCPTAPSPPSAPGSSSRRAWRWTRPATSS